MTDECNLGKWKLLIGFFNKKENKNFAAMIIGTACICTIIIFWKAGDGISQASKLLTLKTACFYEK